MYEKSYSILRSEKLFFLPLDTYNLFDIHGGGSEFGMSTLCDSLHLDSNSSNMVIIFGAT